MLTFLLVHLARMGPQDCFFRLLQVFDVLLVALDQVLSFHLGFFEHLAKSIVEALNNCVVLLVILFFFTSKRSQFLGVLHSLFI